VNRRYFLDYCGRGAYGEIWRDHSGTANCIANLRRRGVRVASLLVLGTATGEVLREFERAFGVRPHGCELSRWAHARIPARFRGRVRRADLRRHVPALVRAGARFDAVFTSALVYLPAADVVPVLRDCARLAPLFHFYASTSEDFEPNDRHRTLLRPRRWWRARFREAGWAPTRSRYLWRRAGD